MYHLSCDSVYLLKVPKIHRHSPNAPLRRPNSQKVPPRVPTTTRKAMHVCLKTHHGSATTIRIKGQPTSTVRRRSAARGNPPAILWRPLLPANQSGNWERFLTFFESMRNFCNQAYYDGIWDLRTCHRLMGVQSMFFCKDKQHARKIKWRASFDSSPNASTMQ